MSEWSLYGEQVRDQVDRDLDPEELSWQLDRYQAEFGEEFGITELLKVRDIQAKARIAEAICNAPEFLIDQIGKARNSSFDFPSVSGELANFNDLFERYLDGKGI